MRRPDHHTEISGQDHLNFRRPIFRGFRPYARERVIANVTVRMKRSSVLPADGATSNRASVKSTHQQRRRRQNRTIELRATFANPISDSSRRIDRLAVRMETLCKPGSFRTSVNVGQAGSYVFVIGGEQGRERPSKCLRRLLSRRRHRSKRRARRDRRQLRLSPARRCRSSKARPTAAAEARPTNVQSSARPQAANPPHRATRWRGQTRAAVRKKRDATRCTCLPLSSSVGDDNAGLAAFVSRVLRLHSPFRRELPTSISDDRSTAVCPRDAETMASLWPRRWRSILADAEGLDSMTSQSTRTKPASRCSSVLDRNIDAAFRCAGGRVRWPRVRGRATCQPPSIRRSIPRKARSCCSMQFEDAAAACRQSVRRRPSDRKLSRRRRREGVDFGQRGGRRVQVDPAALATRGIASTK